MRRTWGKGALVVTILSALLPLCCAGQIERHQSPNAADALKTFLRSYLHSEDDKSLRYAAAFADLNGDGAPEAIVYVRGRSWCGTGGCNTLILSRSGSSYRVVADIMVTRPPIRVLPTRSYGWHNISVWVQGGGIQPGYAAELRFDGKKYPGNPSVIPARRLEGTLTGNVVISSSDEGIPLYY